MKYPNENLENYGDKVTTEINEKRNDILKLNQIMVMLKEESKRVKQKLHKIENAKNYLTDKRETLKKGNRNSARSK